jgi:hypothetical protein
LRRETRPGKEMTKTMTKMSAMNLTNHINESVISAAIRR